MKMVQEERRDASVAEKNWVSEAWLMVGREENHALLHEIYENTPCNCFSLPESFSVGPQVPSVAVYSTKDKKSECPPTSDITMFSNYTALFPAVLIDRRLCKNKPWLIFFPAEVFDVETNERVNDTYNNMQMPKVENKTIVIDDYSMYFS